MWRVVTAGTLDTIEQSVVCAAEYSVPSVAAPMCCPGSPGPGKCGVLAFWRPGSGAYFPFACLKRACGDPGGHELRPFATFFVAGALGRCPPPRRRYAGVSACGWPRCGGMVLGVVRPPRRARAALRVRPKIDTASRRNRVRARLSSHCLRGRAVLLFAFRLYAGYILCNNGMWSIRRNPQAQPMCHTLPRHIAHRTPNEVKHRSTPKPTQRSPATGQF